MSDMKTGSSVRVLRVAGAVESAGDEGSQANTRIGGEALRAMESEIDAGVSQRHPLIASSVTIGVMTACVMWCVWLLTHMPATVQWFPPQVAGPVLLVAAIAALCFGLRWVPASKRVVTGAVSGVAAALPNLLLLGSKVTTVDAEGKALPQAEGLVPHAGIVAVGFIVVMAVAGAITGLVMSKAAKGESSFRTGTWWLRKFAWVNVAAVLPLIALGGLTTTARAGMAVPDWPGTYGANMFLYPISLMSNPYIFLEHSHRLFGAFVGLVTFVSMVFAMFASPRTWQTWLAAVLFVLVCVQGLLGGLRVTENSIPLAIVHGVLAQGFLGLLAFWAASLQASWLGLARHGARLDVRTPLVWVLASVVCLFIMLVFGGLIRHMNSPHGLYSHIGFSFITFGVVVIAGIKMMKLKGAPLYGKKLYWAGHGVLIVVTVQFLLGWVALLMWMSSDTRMMPMVTEETMAAAPPVVPVEMLIRTSHQTNGAVLMAAACVMVAWGVAGQMSKWSRGQMAK
jgi:heme a synthase